MKNNKTINTICAGGIVINDKNEVAIVNQNHDSYSLPKGHVDDNESYLEAAKREIYEETGIEDLIYVKELGKYSRYRISQDGKDDLSELKTIYIYLFKSNQIKLIPQDPNNPFAIWVNPKKVNDYLTHPADREFFKNSMELWIK